MIILKARFTLGRTYATSGVTRWADQNAINLADYLRRHHCGDWGDLDPDDHQANIDALEHGDRIFSTYKIADRKIYIVTEHDRSMTTIMLSEEY